MLENGSEENNVSVGRVDDIDRHVGKKLRQKRIYLGLSQQALGEEVGVSIQQIQKYEKATNRIASGKLYQFAQLLKEPISYFYEGVEDVVSKIKPSFAEAQEEFSGKDIVHEREILSLVRAFNEIPDAGVRKTVLDLVKKLST